MDSVRIARERLPQWHLRCLECFYYGIASGKVTSKKFKDVLVARKDLDHQVSKKCGSDFEGGSMQRAQAELRRLRDMCDNTLTMAIMFYSDSENLHRQAILAGVAAVAHEWQGSMNARCRSVEESFKSQLQWCRSDFLASCSQTLQRLSSPSALIEMKFQLKFSSAELKDLSMHHPMVAQANEWSDIAGKLILNLVAARINKFMDLIRGWPRRCVLLASDSAIERESTLAELKEDMDIFEAMVAQPFPEVTAMRKRSLFNLPCVQQFVEIARQEGWQCSVRLMSFARQVNLRLVQTQVSEDAFNRERQEEDKGKTKKVCDERAWKCLIEPELLHTVHDFRSVSWRSEPTPRGMSLPKSMFRPSMQNVSDPRLHEIQGRMRKTPWYSPSPCNICQPICDMVVSKIAADCNLWHLLDKAWLSALLTTEPVAVRHVDWPLDDWSVSLGQFGSSLALGWPLVRHCWMQNQNYDWSSTWFSFSEKVLSHKDLKWLLIVDETKWLVMNLSLSSPLDQMLRHPGFDFDHGRLASIRLEPKGPAKPLLQHSAEMAFVSVSKLVLVKLAGYLGMSTGSSSTTFQLLFDLVTHITQLNENDVLLILKKRLGQQEINVSELLNLGDNIEILDKADQSDITKERKSHKASELSRAEFAQEFKAKRIAVSHARSGPSSTSSSKPLAKYKKVKMPKVGHLTQPWVQSNCPPGCLCWKSSEGSWQVHLPPWPRKSRSWNIEGEEAAAKFVLKYAWELYLNDLNLPLSRCPIIGLFD